jgi:hypothetical protein
MFKLYQIYDTQFGEVIKYTNFIFNFLMSIIMVIKNIYNISLVHIYELMYLLKFIKSTTQCNEVDSKSL